MVEKTIELTGLSSTSIEEAVSLAVAHGGVFKDHRYRAKQIIQHHKYRLEEMRDIVHAKAQSAYEVASQVFDLKSELPIFHIFAATFETFAHLHLFMYNGEVRRLEDDGTIRFVV